MSKELDYIADLERENRLVKSFLYCTTKSCNNCGKVNCENFQRQRIDCCGLWVSYKDYIAELEKENRLLGERCNQLLKDKGKLIDQIADIKANCDLAIEGRDVKIKELEKENEELRNNGFTVSAMTEQQLKVAIEKGEQLERDFRICEKNADTYYDQRTKATEIIKALIALHYNPVVTKDDLKKQDTILEQAEQFLKEIEK